MAFILNPDAKFRQSSYITKLTKKKGASHELPGCFLYFQGLSEWYFSD